MQPIPKARFEQFSDGVFAIAITLLALELRAPNIHSTDIAHALKELAPLVPTIVTFVISFITIAIFWVNHHQLTQMIDVVKQRRILWSNILFLLFLTLIPFVTQAASLHPTNPINMLTYGLVLFGGSLSFSLVRYFIHKSAGEPHIPMRRSLFGPALYLLAALVAHVSIDTSYVLLALPAVYYFLPKSHVKGQ
jgi:uncharacterized membrane protein